jgi:hypothetical protein
VAPIPPDGAPEMTTSGGAGDVFSPTGDRRGVMGCCGASDDGSPFPLPLGPKGGCEVRLIGDDMGEEGPAGEPAGSAGVGLDAEGEGVLFLASLDFVLERFCLISLLPTTTALILSRSMLIVKRDAR